LHERQSRPTAPATPARVTPAVSANQLVRQTLILSINIPSAGRKLPVVPLLYLFGLGLASFSTSFSQFVFSFKLKHSEQFTVPPPAHYVSFLPLGYFAVSSSGQNRTLFLNFSW
jgi:hypothetical protein